MKMLLNNDNSFRQEVDNFITQWHSNFIIDLWWRKKHNVAFGSEAHRSMNFIDMYIEYREDEKIRRLREQEYQIDDVSGVKVSQKEIDEDYENLDLKEFDNAKRND